MGCVRDSSNIVVVMSVVSLLKLFSFKKNDANQTPQKGILQHHHRSSSPLSTSPSLHDCSRCSNTLKSLLEMTDIENPPVTDIVVTAGCCGRFRAKWSLSFFDSKDANGKTLDLAASFSHNPSWFVLAGKVALWTVAFADLVKGWKDSDPIWYLAYLSDWELLLSVIYLTLSLTLSLVKPLQQKFVIYTTWQLFSLSAVFEVIITALFWILDYE